MGIKRKTLTTTDSEKGQLDIKKIATWDIETTPWEKGKKIKVALIGIYYPHETEGEKYYEFETFDEFFEHVLTGKRKGYHYWAHNAGKFDNNLLWRELIESIEYEFHIIDSQGSIIQMRITDKDRSNFKKHYYYRWWFHDSIHLIPGSLEDLTNDYDVETKKKDFDLNKIKVPVSRMDPQDRKDLSDYLRGDCVGLWQVMEKFNKSIEKIGGITGLTQASTAMKTWRTNYMPDVEIPNYRPLEQPIKGAYHGGRCEVFTHFGKDIYAYDVNSLYPSVMVEPLPVGMPSFYNMEHGFNPDDINGVIACEVQAPDLDVPILPVKGRIEGTEKLLFPTGRFHGVWDTKELEAAKEHGYEIKKLYWAIDFPDNQPIFKDYVESLYQQKTKLKREEQMGSLYQSIKILLNSLYGKTAMHRKQDELIQYPSEKKFKKWIEKGKGITPWDEKLEIYKFADATDAVYIVPMLATRITSLARLVLWKQLNKHSDNLYYCDTDSIFIDEKLPEALVDPYELGLWDLEFKFEEAVFLTSKLYGGINENGERKFGHKGLRKEDITYEDMKKAYTESDGSYLTSKWTAPGGFRSSIRRSGEPISVFTFDRTPKLKNYKRKFGKNKSEPVEMMYGKPMNLDVKGDPEVFKEKCEIVFNQIKLKGIKINEGNFWYEAYTSSVSPLVQNELDKPGGMSLAYWSTELDYTVSQIIEFLRWVEPALVREH